MYTWKSLRYSNIYIRYVLGKFMLGKDFIGWKLIFFYICGERKLKYLFHEANKNQFNEEEKKIIIFFHLLYNRFMCLY